MFLKDMAFFFLNLKAKQKAFEGVKGIFYTE